MKFADMGLSDSTLKALEKKGFETPSPIQEACIPLLLSGTKDIIGQAQTGTGKTAAFAIPVIEKIDPKKKHVQAVVIAPTRELAVQVSKEMSSLTGSKKISIVQVYGGASIGKQLKELRDGPQVVVGTPGRMIDMINRGKLKLGKVDFCILDEADEMLNMGFLDEIEEILKSCNEDRQMLCFSATMPQSIKRVASRYMGEYELVKVAASQLTTGNTEQQSMHLREKDKFEALTRVIDSNPGFYSIVFCKTKKGCDDLVHKLQGCGYRADALHGDLNQKKREFVLQKFKTKRITLLIATDVAARGIDVDDLTHVVNYNLPQDAECYTHRIGRTGRAGKKGIALTLVTKKDEGKLRRIMKTTKADIKRVDVPSIKSVLTLKKAHTIKKIQESLPETVSEEQMEMVRDLLAVGSSEQVISGLLTIAFGKQLTEEGYQSISSQGGFGKKDPNEVRLFVARGRKDGFAGPRELVERLESETEVPQEMMDDVAIRDNFSFITCPKKEANLILDAFKDRPGRALVSVSKDGERKSYGSGKGGKGFKKGKEEGKHQRKGKFGERRKDKKKDRKKHSKKD